MPRRALPFWLTAFFIKAIEKFNRRGYAIGEILESIMLAANLLGDIRHWMFSDALPFWAEHGHDKQFGGFIEELTFSGSDAALPYKRTRVTCRQIYVFSHAKLLGWTDGAALIAQGVEYLVTRAWLGEDKGFARRLTRESNLLDETPDLYDHAFAIFAFAWAHKATGDATYREWAEKTFDFVYKHLRHPDGRGFWHEIPPKGWRLQNPHMHLLEASLAAYDATQDVRFRGMVAEITGLFQNDFFNRNTNTLAEYFNDDWSVATSEEGRIVEPGHQLEWAWILQNCSRILGIDVKADIHALVRFSEKHGVNAHTGAVMNAVRDNGRPIDDGSRIWPNTERLKAAIALRETDGSDTMALINDVGRLLLDRYLSSSPTINIPAGGWIDAFDGNGAPIAERMPASTFYHLFLAFAEILRIGEP